METLKNTLKIKIKLVFKKAIFHGLIRLAVSQPIKKFVFIEEEEGPIDQFQLYYLNFI